MDVAASKSRGMDATSFVVAVGKVYFGRTFRKC